MTICEIINERNEVTRIEYWDDLQVRVVQSNGYSTLYGIKMQEIEREHPSLKIGEIQHYTDLWIQSHKTTTELNNNYKKYLKER